MFAPCPRFSFSRMEKKWKQSPDGVKVEFAMQLKQTSNNSRKYSYNAEMFLVLVEK